MLPRLQPIVIGSIAVACAATLAPAQPRAGSHESPAGPPAANAAETPPEVLRAQLERPDDPFVPPLPRPTPSPEGPPSTVRRGPFVSVQVNVDQFGRNITGDAGNEPSIAIDVTDPNRIAIGWRQFDTVTNNFRQAGRAYSTDGGQTWTNPGVLTPGLFRSDPVLRPGPDGEIYYYSLSGRANFECDVFRSFDGGATFGPPIYAFGGDKAWIEVDHTNGTGRGHIYCFWSAGVGCCGNRNFTRSTDGGLTWMNPITTPSSPRWGTLAIDPNGTLYLAGAAGTTGAPVVRSTNAQNPAVTPTFSPAVFVDMGGTTPFQVNPSPNPVGLLGQMWIAADHSGGPTHGNIYLLQSVDTITPDPLDVHFVRSTDGGATWSPWVLVNDDRNGTKWQWFGTMSVAPNGRIDAVWNDSRNSTRVNDAELFYSYSTNAGQTWSKNIPVSPMYDSHVGWPQQNKLGDYYDMSSDAAAANVAYAATFNGEQDVYFIRLGDCNENGVHDGEDIAAGTSLDCNRNTIPDECEYEPGVGCPTNIRRGDMNCDNAVNGADAQRFVTHVVTSAYTCQADMNQDGVVDEGDVGPFAAAMLGP